MTQPLMPSTTYRAALNQCWADLMLEELSRLGVRDVCIAPGSRSTPLTLAAANHPNLTIHTHFDERGLGFLALGLAKANDLPVAVIVTSGTAVANLLPAVAEAGLTGEKLVLLTSDRPAELIACGANQAIVQAGIFSSHVTAYHDIPSPSLDVPAAWLLTTLDEAMHQQVLLGGAVHFNCHYPEPLYGELHAFNEYLAPVAEWQLDKMPYLTFQLGTSSALPAIDPQQWAEIHHGRGVIIAGKLSPHAFSAVEALAEQLGWPLLADPQSGGSSAYQGFDVWLQNEACQQLISQADTLLQFGARLVSKRLGQFIAANTWSHYWLVDASTGRLDASHRRGVRIQANCLQWAEQALLRFAEIAEQPAYRGWGKALESANSEYQGLLQSQTDQLSELSLAYHLPCWVNVETEWFLGNSLIVRLLDMCGSLPTAVTFANRGASGIDGLIATAAGIQRARQVPLIALLGDTSLLYDLNSLALLRAPSTPMVVIVTNNDGGGIFDLLPVPSDQRDDFYRMPHGLNFQHAAAMFGLNYVCPQSLSQTEDAVRQGLAHTGTTLIEVKTPAGEAGEALKALFAEVKNASLL
ncbi:2-succinyl-5-enolpyruvyl-6-hydroxy-3-cyclohexene-1-carboxylic-acid synthase [Photobacterium sanguinicancri]|uniref:2-succinyl-5-enolpyruvyl-6-hydroxy-3-cyclohexene-1-carboxylate synthase n=1 Tax=Photobacterium sanguinicancri TaxID=875932 RepID=A0ABX4FZ98_9GAMM|nr:2-succinyl-5-enolpyruvyl-6-hydroxy-3-cyclohexene-1-carboxylic-acid synthase [Photobacterium sanguinicancri]OZS44056.1 2-succinyl-5-enolpyruvyl-6-hydroxy-3-cyclohexene-1-carboxylic-acid synthase [Photobacterium sanguinicancri]